MWRSTHWIGVSDCSATLACRHRETLQCTVTISLSTSTYHIYPTIHILLSLKSWHASRRVSCPFPFLDVHGGIWSGWLKEGDRLSGRLIEVVLWHRRENFVMGNTNRYSSIFFIVLPNYQVAPSADISAQRSIFELIFAVLWKTHWLIIQAQPRRHQIMLDPSRMQTLVKSHNYAPANP